VWRGPQPRMDDLNATGSQSHVSSAASTVQSRQFFESTLPEELFKLKNEETFKKSENLRDICTSRDLFITTMHSPIQSRETVSLKGKFQAKLCCRIPCGGDHSPEWVMIPGLEGEADSCYALYGHYSDPKYQATSWREAEAACAYEVLYLHILYLCALSFVQTVYST
jgi:hypothetical protein